MTHPPLIEICCDGFAAAGRAAEMGADRIELCENLGIGGVTPSFPDIEMAAALEVPVNVLIRPRGGDFVYDTAEIEDMMRSIAFCGSVGVNGVVIGALLPSGEVDLPLCRDMVAMARSEGLSVTFHRAIDASADIFRALDDVMSLGVDRVLSSGAAPSAWEGRETLAEMVRRAQGRLTVMPGCGISAQNAVPLMIATGAREFHGSRPEIIQSLRSPGSLIP